MSDKPINPPPADLLAALREAFDAGVKQGEDQATSYEWGQPPRQSADEAFRDFVEWGWRDRSVQGRLPEPHE